MRVWQRLIWKEYRESSPFVLIGVLLPLLCLTFHKFRGDIVVLPAYLLILMIAVWAASRPRERLDGGLPISAPVRLASRYLLPVVGVVAIGVSLGCLLAFRQDPLVHLHLIPVTVSMLLVCYLCCTVISCVYASILAALCGVVFAWSSTVLFTTSTVYISENLGAQLRVLVAVLLIAVFWEVYRGKRRVLIGRIALPSLIVIALGWGLIAGSDIDNLLSFHVNAQPTAPMIAVSSWFYNYDSERIDGTLIMDYDNSQRAAICLLDRRIPRRYFIAPERIAPAGDYLRALQCLDRHVVLFAVQSPHNEQIRVMTWDAHTGRVCERFRFTGWRGMLAYDCASSLSPDNRYLLLDVNSNIGGGDDFWLLDLPCNRATLVAPNTERDQDENGRKTMALREAIWTSSRVIIELEKRNILVDLRSLQVAPLRIGEM